MMKRNGIFMPSPVPCPYCGAKTYPPKYEKHAADCSITEYENSKKLHLTLPDASYYTDRYGVLHQLDAKPIQYDAHYIERHTSKPNYVENSHRLNGLRLGFIVGGIGRIPWSLLDYGYGDGSFATLAAEIVPLVSVYDVTDLPAPRGCKRVSDPKAVVEVVTYWDSLEHVPNLEKAIDIPAEWFAVSVPCMPDRREFESWKHRRPNEHLHHFTDESLVAWAESQGWRVKALDFMEDAVRGGPRNILSALFCRF